MSRFLPQRLRGLDVNNNNQTTFLAMNVTQSHHHHEGIIDIYGANVMVMALPVFVVMFLVSLYTRHKMKQPQSGKICPIIFNRVENGNSDDKGNLASSTGGKKNVRTRKPMFSNGKYNKVRYHQQKPNDYMQDGSKGDEETEDIGIYNDFYDENDPDYEDEEIDLQKQGPMLTNSSMLSTASTSTLGSTSDHTTASSAASSQQAPGSTVVLDDAILQNMMQTMRASLTFQAWMPNPLSPVPTTTTSSAPKLSLSDEESKEVLRTSTSTSSSGTFGGIFRSLWSTPPPTEDVTTTSSSSLSKPPAVKLILDDAQKLHPHNQYFVEDPDTADFRRHIPLSSASAPLRSVLVTNTNTNTNAMDNKNSNLTHHNAGSAMSFASDSEDDDSAHGVGAFGGNILQNMAKNELVTVFDDSHAVKATTASMHPHQQMKLKQLAYSLRL